MLKFVEVRSDAEAKAAETLAWEFVDWLRGRYPDMRADIDNYMVAQKFAERMADVRMDYGPPVGETLLCLSDDEPVGLLMMRAIGDDVCEMNRMFVRESARGRGVGRALAERLISIARDRGFRAMRLGALPRHLEALGLYRSLGFREDTEAPLAGSGSNSIRLALDLTAD